MVSSDTKDIELVENKSSNQDGELVTNFVPLKDGDAPIHTASPPEKSAQDAREEPAPGENREEVTEQRVSDTYVEANNIAGVDTAAVQGVAPN